MLQRHAVLIGICALVLSALLHASAPTPERVLPGKFVSAQLSSDGSIGVITFHRPLPVDRDYNINRGFFGRAPKPMPIGLVSDRNYVGVYYTATSAFRVVVRKDNTECLQGSGQFAVFWVKGTTALIGERCQLRNYDDAPGKLYLLEISPDRLTAVPLREELAQRSATLAHVYLFNADGVMVIDTTDLLDIRAPSEQLGDERLALWVRYPSGEYIRLSDNAMYLRDWSTADEIFYVFGPRLSRRAFNVRTKTTRDVPGTEERQERRSGPSRFLQVSDNRVWLHRSGATGSVVEGLLAIDTDAMK